MIEDELHSVVARIAACEVAASDRSIDFEGLPEADWQQILAATRLARVEPQLAAAVADDANRATAAQVEDAQLLHARAMATVLLLDRQLLEVAELFDRAGVDFVVLKGAASAHLDRPDPSDRSYGDVDVLVPAPHIDRAEGLMTDGGRAARLSHRHAPTSIAASGRDRRSARAAGSRSTCTAPSRWGRSVLPSSPACCSPASRGS